MLKQIVKNY